MSYEIDELREVEDIKTQIFEQIVDGYKLVSEEVIVYFTGTVYYDLLFDNITITRKLKDILNVRGIKDGIEYIFVNGTDYEPYDSDGDGYYDQISWGLGGNTPDDETVFYIDYRYIWKNATVTDTTPGSVLDVFVDAMSRQLRKMDLKLNRVAMNSFIDSAAGRQLDQLGRLVAINRNESTRTTGYITLSRSASMTSGEIAIPVGTQVSTVGTSTSPTKNFETTVTSSIADGSTQAKVSDATHQDYDNIWIPVQSVIPGEDNNVSSETIIRNVNAYSTITTINNPSTFDTSDERVDGNGNTQVFTLNHTADSNGLIDKDSDGKAIEMKDELDYGWVDQPTAKTEIRFRTTDGVGGAQAWSGQIIVTGYASNTDFFSETVTFSAESGPIDTIAQFDYIYDITITSTGGSGLPSGTYLKITNLADSETLLDEENCGARVDSGFLILRPDGTTDLKVYLWDGTVWRLQTITTDYTYSTKVIGTLTKGLIDWVNWHDPYINTEVFAGVGLDDLTSGGTYSGSDIQKTYVIEIDTTGTPDTFQWSDDGGSTWNATGVSITGAAQTLNDGVQITFGATTGHTLADQWLFDAGVIVSDGTQNVKYEYVPHEDWYRVDGNILEVDGAPRSGSYLLVDYTWINLFQDGADIEVDDTYKIRIKTGITTTARATLVAIESAVLGIDGISIAGVDDYSTDGTIATAQIRVIAAGASGILTEAKRTEVSNIVDEYRSAGIQATILGPDPIYIAIEVDVKVISGEGYSLTTVAIACETAISDWISSKSIGDDLTESELISTIEEVTGISYMDVDSIVVKGFDESNLTAVSTREPYPGGWSWAAGTHWNIISIAGNDVVKPDTDTTGGAGSAYYIDVTATFE